MGLSAEEIELLCDVPWPSGPFVPHAPEPPQLAYLWLECLEAMYGGAAGGGKALALDTPLPTPDGWVNMGAVQPGDYLLGADGKPVKVLACSPIMRHICYDIEFDDGSVITADRDHLWRTLSKPERERNVGRTRDRVARLAKRRAAAAASRIPGPRPDLAARNAARVYVQLPPIEPALRTSENLFKTQHTRHSIPVAAPLQLPETNLPIDPYLLGAWLGDGGHRTGVICNHPTDEQIIDEIKAAGYECHRGKDLGVRVTGLTTLLKRCGLYMNKHIPQQYLRASYEQRLALMQGLMDTDGTASGGACEVGFMNWRLASDAHELAMSLGIKATLRKKHCSLNGKYTGTGMVFKFRTALPMFRLERKLAEQKQEGFRGTHNKRCIVSVSKRTAPVKVKCVKVSAHDGMFLCGEAMIPTHNSDALLMAALQYIDVPGYAALLLRKTYTELSLENALLDRSHKWLSHTKAHWNGEHRRWTFPSGATLAFGYLQNMKDRARYQSAEYQMIGFDELTAFAESDYRFMFSRMRKPSNMNLPLRMRSATNPGGQGHKWVKERFIDPFLEKRTIYDKNGEITRIFIPAKLSDNPHVDQQSYIAGMEELDPELRDQLLLGDWNAREPGDWMIPDHRWIDAAEELGYQMWEDGPPPPPDGIIHLGIDWGEHTQGYVIWPLPGGGVFIPPSEVVAQHEDPAETSRMLLKEALKFGLELHSARYDAAGVQSMRTFVNIARKVPGLDRVRSTAIPFNKYKRESIGYLRTLLRRVYAGEDRRIIAIHPDNTELLRQMRTWRRRGPELDEAVKEDDHGPDAVLAGIAPLAATHRAYIERKMAEATGDGDDAYLAGDAEGTEVTARAGYIKSQPNNPLWEEAS